MPDLKIVYIKGRKDIMVASCSIYHIYIYFRKNDDCTTVDKYYVIIEKEGFMNFEVFAIFHAN